MIPSKKELEILLSTIKDFEKPKPELEQYITPSDIAAELLWYAFMKGDIKNKIVIDLGCGTGILSFGAALLGAKKVYGVEIDRDALEIAKKNEKILQDSKIPVCDIVWIEKDIKDVNLKGNTIVMNPPFGIQRPHADVEFLNKAFEIAEVTYSILKAGNESFISEFAKNKGLKSEIFSKGIIHLKHKMPFHQKRKYPVEITLWRFFYEKILK